MAEENKVESGVVLPPADFTEQLQKEALDRRILPGIGNGVENAAQQADETADSDHGTEGSCDQTFFG